MTRIKYATIARSRKTGRITVVRGKKTGRIGLRPPDDDDADPFSDPIYREATVELPQPMSPDEYDEYIHNLDDPNAAVVQAFNRVAGEHDYEHRWPVA
jgi:hypothetical protein